MIKSYPHSIKEIKEVSSRVRDLIPDIFDKDAGKVTMSFKDAMDLLHSIDVLLELASDTDEFLKETSQGYPVLDAAKWAKKILANAYGEK